MGRFSHVYRLSFTANTPSLNVLHARIFSLEEIKGSLREYLPEELPFQNVEVQAHHDEQILTNLLSRSVDCGFLC